MKNSATKIITLLFIATILTSCSVDMFNSISGNRNVITQLLSLLGCQGTRQGGTGMEL